jgi:competence protein ComEA
VYRLPSGSRVDDLVRAAGGLAPGADGDRLNLAAPLGDGQRLFVPKPGQEPPPAVSAVGGEGGDGSGAVPGTGAGPASATGTPTTPVDLNAADATQLDSLPGVGPATAQAILSYRSQHGPFHTVDDLLQVRGIGPAKLDQMRALVRVDG